MDTTFKNQLKFSGMYLAGFTAIDLFLSTITKADNVAIGLLAIGIVIFAVLLGRKNKESNQSWSKIVAIVIATSILMFIIAFIIEERYVIPHLESSTVAQPEVTNTLCKRETPHTREPIIEAALKIIRDVEGRNDNYPRIATVLNNCLNIQFASDETLSGAEGAFYFVPENDINNLQILVSDRYRYEDVTVIATLLQHEVQHAILHIARMRSPENVNLPSCANEEAGAFLMQLRMFVLLPEQAREQVAVRIAASENILHDPEIDALYSLFKFSRIHNLENEEYSNEERRKIIEQKFVSTNPAYQEQCSGR